jgi:opacity protein-like surface antigen
MRSEFSCAAGLLAAAGAGPAVAADLAVRPPLLQPVAAAPAYVPEWAGFYFGIHSGGGWAHSSFDVPGLRRFPISTFPDTAASGGVFGGHAGYNWQYGPFVSGVEADFSGAGIKETAAFFVGAPISGTFARELKIDGLASARGRLGYALLPNVLVFGTAGLGWAHTRLTVSDPLGIMGAPGTTGGAFVNEFGWVAGAGLEYRMFEHLLLRVEYLHYDFGRSTAADALAPAGVFDVNVNIRDRVDVVRGGVTYKF